MNTKEIEISNSIIESVLSTNELANLKQNLQTDDNFQHFLTKYIEIVIGMDESMSLLEFLDFNRIASKFIPLNHKANDLIEELADLSFKGYQSIYTDFLNKTQNKIFLNHLNFLENTQQAIKINQRAELKKKFQQIEKLDTFDLSENEIKSAITILERQKIKNQLNDIAEKENKEKRIDSEKALKYGFIDEVVSEEKKGTRIISINFKSVLKYAAIIILILSPTIFLINRLNHNKGNNEVELADNKKAKDLNTKDNKKKLPLDTFQLPNSEICSIENEVLRPRNFGFTATLITKIKISIINISSQIDALEKECKKSSTEIGNTGYGPIAKKYCTSYDSLISIKETYTFNKKLNTLSIYTTKWKADKKFVSQIKIISFINQDENRIYMKTSKNYYLIKTTGNYNRFVTESNDEITDKLMLIENQNE